MCILDLNANPIVLDPNMGSTVKWTQRAPFIGHRKHFPSREYEKKLDLGKKKPMFLDLDSIPTLQ